MIKKILPLYTLLLFVISVSAQTFNIPFTEDFESTAAGGTSSPNAPDDWSYINSGMGGYTYVRSSSSSAQSGSKYYRLSNGINLTGDYMLISPEIAELTTDGVQVNFSVSGVTGLELQMGTMSDPNDASTFTLLKTKTLSSNGNYDDVKVNITAGTDAYFAIRHGLTSIQAYFNLDDFSFTELPSCIEPENLLVSNISESTVTLSWDSEPLAINGYEYQITTSPFYTGVAIQSGSVVAGENSIVVTGLSSGITYYAFVRSNCGDDTSDWSSGFSFKTLCFVDLPFSEGFETTDSGNLQNPNAPTCWSYIDNGFVQNYENNEFPQSGEGCYELDNGDTSITPELMLISPAILELTTTGITVNFGARSEMLSGNEIEIGTISNPTDVLTFSVLETILVPYESTSYQNLEVSLPAGSDYYFALRVRGLGLFNSFFLDNFTFSASTSSYINIPDPNFEQALIDLNIDSDGVINGQMLQSDAIGITSLDVSDENISDLTGIAYFTDVLNLFAVNNAIATIDVSQNTALTGLVLTQNNLSSIDVSNNSNLQTLILSDNEITSIDLSNLTALSKLYLQNNLLTEIDTSVLPALSEFVIFQNDLSALDLSQNPALIQVLCSENDLVSLNLQNENNTSINGAFFDATQNPNLTCIQVDDVDYSELNWTAIDSQTSFSTNCTPDNDDCADATSITLGQDTPGTTVNSTSSDSNPACEQEGIVILDVWYQFIAPDSGSVTMIINAPPLIGKIAIYENCSATSPLDCAQDELQINNLNPGQTYYLQVWLEASVSGRASTLNNEGSFVLNVQDTTLSLETIEQEPNEINLHPNPATDNVTITSGESIDSYSIFDFTGKLIVSASQLQLLETSIDTSALSQGVYLIQVTTQHSTITKRLLIN